MINIEGIIEHAQELPSDLFYHIAEDEGLVPGASFLDIGTGPTGVVGLHWWNRHCIEKHALDIYAIRDMPPDWITHKMDMRKALEVFGVDRFSIVQLCDVIEHVPAKDGEWLLGHALPQLCRGAIFVWTPDGWYDNTENKEKYQPDNPHQDHQSAWTRGMLADLGYESRLINDHIAAWRVR